MTRRNSQEGVVYDASYRTISRLIGMDLDEYFAGLARHSNKLREERAQRISKAMAISPTVYVCEALLRGERVPWQALDYWVAERYGLREGAPENDRFTLDDFNDIPRP